MEDVLDRIIEAKRIEVARSKEAIPVEKLMANLPSRKAISMRESLLGSASGIIAEFKRRSPSKGWIREGADPAVIPPSYALSGASAISILTDGEFFGGGLEDLKMARPLVESTPILRKEFIVDEYQLYEAAVVEADAVLLIASALSLEECEALTRKAHELGLEVLLELHSESELEYISTCPDMVGINNRNLGTFHTDVKNSYRMAELLPKDMVKISESGIYNPETVRELREAGFRGFLIGENFMRAEDPGVLLREFIAEVER